MPKMGDTVCLAESNPSPPEDTKINTLSLKCSLEPHSWRAAAMLLPLGPSQDDVQAASAGRGNVVHEAADTEEDEHARPWVLQR